MVRTYKNIIKELEKFCNSHTQINDFGWGLISNITTKDHDFAMVWIQPTGANINGHLITLSYQMIVFDLVKQDMSNLLDVQSDCLLIGNDIITNFWDNEYDYGWTINENGIDAEPFDHKFDDYTAGHIFSIEIEVENRMNSCAIPIEQEEIELPTYALQQTYERIFVKLPPAPYYNCFSIEGNYTDSFSIGDVILADEIEYTIIEIAYQDNLTKLLYDGVFVADGYRLISSSSTIIDIV